MSGNRERRAERHVLAAIGSGRASLSEYHQHLGLFVSDADARAALDRLTRQGAVIRDPNGGMRRDLQKWTERGTNQ